MSARSIMCADECCHGMVCGGVCTPHVYVSSVCVSQRRRVPLAPLPISILLEFHSARSKVVGTANAHSRIHTNKFTFGLPHVICRLRCVESRILELRTEFEAGFLVLLS